MDELLTTHSEVLVDGLRFEAGSKASSITERREATCHVSGSSEYSSVGGRTMKFVISDGWVALNTIRFQCEVEAGTADFQPLGSLPNPLLQSFRLLISGTVASNLDTLYGRPYFMMELFLPSSSIVAHYL